MRRQQVESQMYLETRNTRLLTFLATVYVPLAFVTVRWTFPSFVIMSVLNLDQSFLGMNITEFSTPFSTNFNTTSPSSAGSGSASASCSQGSPNPQLWNLSAFGKLSGSLLLVTIIVPVIIGPMTRFLVRTWVFWVCFLVLFVPLFCFSLIPVLLTSKRESL